MRQAAHSGELLCATAAKGDIEFLKLLIEHGADVNKADDNGKTPLRIAIEKGHVEIAALLVEHFFKKSNVFVSELECIFQQPDPELGTIYPCLLDLLSEGGFNKLNKVLYFLYGLERSQGIDDTVKETFYTAFAGEIFYQYAQGILSPDTFTDFLLELTKSETIERAPDAFLRAYLDNLLGFIFHFEESQQFERIFCSIPMLKLALHLKDSYHINKSLQIILLREEQDLYIPLTNEVAKKVA